MNLAIVLSVSKYQSKIIDLPACYQDSKAISTLVKGIKKYDNTLFVDDNLPSASVKEKIVNFINSHKDQTIDEVFFYFSGHGEFFSNEYYYLLSDFNSEKRRQTSLENSELDELLRSLNPALTIKVVDACNAGIPYIKDIDQLGSYLKGSGGKFTKCYFFFSSQIDQSSYQDQKLSFFTRSFIEAIISHSAKTIRYKDMMDFISDSFSSDDRQNPSFIIQANFTENFCSVTDTLKLKLRNFIPSKKTEIVQQQIDSGDSQLISLIKEDASKYCSKEEAIEILNKLPKQFEAHTKTSEIKELYSPEINVLDDYHDSLNLKPLGKWVEKYQQAFFIEPVSKEEKYTDYETDYSTIIDDYPGNIYRNQLVNFNNFPNVLFPPKEKKITLASFPTKVTRTRKIVIGVQPTTDMPFRQIIVTFVPKYPNLGTVYCIILPFLSRTKFLFFYSFADYKKTGWGEEYQIEPKLEWKVSEIYLKDQDGTKSFIESISNELWKLTIYPLKKKYGLKEK